MTSQLAQEQNILYQDDTVQIYRDKITILAYYFPIPAAKNIAMIDVEAVHLKDNVDGQAWGTSPGHMDTWFALDQNRHLKKQYLEIVVRDSDVKVAFSPNDPHKVMAIIETNSALLKAEKTMKEKTENTTQIKEKENYTTEVPERQFQQKIQVFIEEPELKEAFFSPNVQPVVVPKKEKKGVGESLKEKLNQKLEGLKNVKESIKQKYDEGKENSYVSPDNRIDATKENYKEGVQDAKLKTGQADKEAGLALEEKGNEPQYNV